MERLHIKEILINQRQRFLNKEIGVIREQLDVARKKLHIPHVMVITGIRRCGKSTLLRQIAKSFFNDDGFYYLNFEDERLLGFRAQEFNDIYEVMIELWGEQKVFLIDEIQNIPNFELFVRRFYDDGFKFIITGSNSEMLSKELGSRLTGRYILLQMSPFNFREYLLYHQVVYSESDVYITETKANILKHFDNYLLMGGMPEWIKYSDSEILQRTYEDIVIKDIAVRHKVDNIALLRELYFYLITNFARPYSYQSLSRFIPIASVNTIKKYISLMEDAFLGSEISQYHFSIKKQLINPKKLYVTDNGFVNLMSGSFTSNKGWLLENLVFNTLQLHGKVYYYSGKNECDFILRGVNSVYAIQVCFELNAQNQKREIAGLNEIIDQFNPAHHYVLSYNQEETISSDGVNFQVIPVWKWLLFGKWE